MYDLFNINEPFKCMSKYDKKEYVLNPNCQSSNIESADRINSIHTTLCCANTNYTENYVNDSTMFVTELGYKQHYCTIFPDIGFSIKKCYDYQGEIRAMLFLRSLVPLEIPVLDYILIPYLEDEIEQIIITIGNKATEDKTISIQSFFKNNKKVSVCCEP